MLGKRACSAALVAAVSALVTGCYMEGSGPQTAGPQTVGACSAFAALGPWDGAEPEEPSSGSAQAPRSLGWEVLAAESIERSLAADAKRLRTLGTVSGPGTAEFVELARSTDAERTALAGYAHLDDEAEKAADGSRAIRGAWVQLEEACKRTPRATPCDKLPKDAAGWRAFRIASITDDPSAASVPAVRSAIEALARAERAFEPKAEALDSKLVEVRAAAQQSFQRRRVAYNRLVARCGNEPPRAPEPGWVGAPPFVDPRGMVVVVVGRTEVAQVPPGTLTPNAPAKRAELASTSADPGAGARRSAELFGTGFLLVRAEGTARKAYVVTNRHVVRGMARVFVVDEHGRPISPAAEVIYEDTNADLAVLALNGPSPVPFGFAISDRPARDGEPITVAGFPALAGRPAYQISRGAVSNAHLSVDGDTFVMHTAPTDPGSSGSPVIDVGGRIVAVASAKATGREAASLAVRRGDLLAMLDRALRAERERNDEAFRRNALVIACLATVESVVDGEGPSTALLSQQLVDEQGPRILAKQLGDTHDKQLRGAMLRKVRGEPRHALEIAVSVDVRNKLGVEDPVSKFELCGGARRATALTTSQEVEVPISTANGMNVLRFSYERGGYRLRGY